MIKVLDYSTEDVIVKLPTKAVSKFFGFSDLSKKDIQNIEFDFPMSDEVSAIKKFQKSKKNNLAPLDVVLSKLNK